MMDKAKWMRFILCGAMIGMMAGCGSSKSGDGVPAEEGITAEVGIASEDAAATEETCAEASLDADMSAGAMWVEEPEIWYGDNSEEYTESTEQGFLSAKSDPRSTFSADVDTASYSNLRRLINEGIRREDIPEGAVRIEEFINYFSYEDLQEPKAGEPFGVTIQIAGCPWNEEAELLRIGLKTQEVSKEDLLPSNLVFLLDVSGSMYDENKLPLLQKSFEMLTKQLSGRDRISIVTYAGNENVVAEGVAGDETEEILEAIYALEAGGSTHGSKGIQTAYRLAEKYFIEEGNNRVILATDGDLNVGLTSETELEKLITRKKESGVFLSVLGFGTGNIKDHKMELLADKGNGNYAYIDSEREAKKVLVEEMGATLLTVCKDVKFQVEFNPAVIGEYRLIGYDNRRLNNEDFADDKKDAGEIGAGHSVTALYEIIRAGTGQERREDLKYTESHEETGKEESADDAARNEWLTLSVRYKEPDGDESEMLQYPVDDSAYTQTPGEEFRFAAAVAEFGLVLSDSSYKKDASLEHVLDELDDLDSKEELRQELSELIEMLLFMD